MFTTVDDLDMNVTQTWNADRSAVLFIMKNSNRDTVDTYIKGNLDILQQWDKSRTLYTIQDISSGKVILTPYLKERLTEVTKYIKSNQINVCTAIVMENNFTGQVMRTFGRLFTINARYLKQVYFTDRVQAQEWIKEQQAKSN